MTFDLETLRLSRGAHDSREDGVCVMEAVAWLAGEEHSDQPRCASPVITRFCQGLNDTWDDDRRQDLIPYVKLIVGTRDGLDDQRALMAADWLFRTYVPTWLRLAGLEAAAARIEAHGPFTDWSMLGEVTVSLRTAADEAAAAWDAARGAARAAARAAAWDAAGDAAWAAAGAAAWDAAWAAAREAAGNAAWDAALFAARDAARVAALTAARVAGAAAWDAARGAARDALEPTVRRLQNSALDLLDRMCRLEAADA